MPTPIPTSQGAFTAEIAGPESGQLVLLLHGFPLSRYSWAAQLSALADTGYHAVAPDQRGYSPGVRPAPAQLEGYAIERLASDALEIAAAVGARDTPFHLVGHDWGGQVAWCLAASHPERVKSLAVLSRPHPTAFRRAYLEDRDGQAEEVATPQGVPRSEHRAVAARGRCEAAARDPLARAHPPRRDRAAPLGARQYRRDGSGAGLVPRGRHASGDRAGSGPGAHALYLGRSGFHRRRDGGARHQGLRPRPLPLRDAPGRRALSNEEAPDAVNRLLLAHLAEAST